MPDFNSPKVGRKPAHRYRTDGAANSIVLLIVYDERFDLRNLNYLCALFGVTPMDVYTAGDRLAKQRKIPERPWSYEVVAKTSRLNRCHNTDEEKWCPRCGKYVPLYDEDGVNNFYGPYKISEAPRTNRGRREKWSQWCKTHAQEENRARKLRAKNKGQQREHRTANRQR